MSNWGEIPSQRQLKAAAAEQARADVLIAHVRRSSGPFNIDTLAQSYALPAARVARIVESAGGKHG